MSHQGVAGTELLIKDTLRLIHSFRTEDWSVQSAAEGWRVQDVIVHLASFCNLIADPEMALPDNPSGTSERLNDALVDERREWTPRQAAEYYETQSAAGLAALTALQSPEYAGATIELADLGTYRLAELSNAVAFDHPVHLSSDVLQPHGPLDRDPIPMDAARIDPAVDWMQAGLPNMCADALRGVLPGPVGFELTGPGARTFVVSWADDGSTLLVNSAAALPDHVVRSSTTAFLRWSTKRSDWRETTDISGDQDMMAKVLDAINII